MIGSGMGLTTKRGFRLLQVLTSPRGDTGSSWAAYVRRVEMLGKGVTDSGGVVERVHLSDLTTARPTLARLLAYRRLRDTAVEYDAVYAANAVAGAVSALAVRGTNTKLVYDVHGDVAQEHQLMWQMTRRRSHLVQAAQMPIMDRIARRGADGILVVSKPSLELYLGLGVPEGRLFLARNGADLEMFGPSPLPGTEGAVRVSYIGSFLAWQGIPNLVAACRVLRRRGWPHRLMLRVVGSGPDDGALRSELSSLLGHAFEPCDRVPYSEMGSQYEQADVLTIPRVPHPALRVAMPTKFAEYLACGRPVLVCDVDETAALVRDHGCGFVAGQGPEALADRLEDVSRASADALSSMGKRARSLAEDQFDWRRIADDTHSFMRALCHPDR